MSSRPRINKIHHNVGSASYCFVWDTAVRRRSTWYNYDISVIQICQSNISFFMPLIRRSLLRDIYQRHLQLQKKTRSVAAGFGRHGMPPPSSNDTCKALDQDGSDWSRDLAILTFDLGGHAPVADAGRRPLSVYQVWSSLALAFGRYGARCVSALMGLVTLKILIMIIIFDLETGVRVASKLGNLRSEFGHTRPSGSQVIRHVRDGRTDKATLNAPSLRAGA